MLKALLQGINVRDERALAGLLPGRSDFACDLAVMETRKIILGVLSQRSS